MDRLAALGIEIDANPFRHRIRLSCFSRYANGIGPAMKANRRRVVWSSAVLVLIGVTIALSVEMLFRRRDHHAGDLEPFAIEFLNRGQTWESDLMLLSIMVGVLDLELDAVLVTKIRLDRRIDELQEPHG